MAISNEFWEAVPLEGGKVGVGCHLVLQHADDVPRVECVGHLDSHTLAEEPAGHESAMDHEPKFPNSNPRGAIHCQRADTHG